MNHLLTHCLFLFCFEWWTHSFNLIFYVRCLFWVLWCFLVGNKLLHVFLTVELRKPFAVSFKFNFNINYITVKNHLFKFHNMIKFFFLENPQTKRKIKKNSQKASTRNCHLHSKKHTKKKEIYCKQEENSHKLRQNPKILQHFSHFFIVISTSYSDHVLLPVFECLPCCCSFSVIQ